MPQGNASPERLNRLLERRSTLTGYEIRELAKNGAGDPNGFAVFGRYPKGFLRHVIKAQWLGNITRDEILHVCSGTLGPEEKWTVDLRPEARPLVVASGTALPFRDASFAAVMIDPPYSDEYARNLYRTEMPRNSWLLKEAARVVKLCGRIGLLHVAIPFSPPGCRLDPKHEPGVVVPLPGEATEWDAQRLHALFVIKDATRVKDEAEARIKQAIGEAEAGLLPDGTTRYSWKTQERAGYTVEPTTLRVLRRTAAK